MSAVIPLARLEPVDIRGAWPDEARNFTPWLAENLDFLGEAIGLDLQLEATEAPVGPFAADILARDVAENRIVLIENQCEDTDHKHLGQILTYAAGLEASIIIWVTTRFREQHRAALDFLNRVTTEDMAFFGVEVRLFRVGSSHFPRFDVIARPNSWARGATEGRRAVEASPEALAWEAYWTSVLAALEPTIPEVSSRKRSRASWQSIKTVLSRPQCSVSLWVLLDSKGTMKAYFEFSGPMAKTAFDRVRSRLGEVETVVGLPLNWDRRENRKGSNVWVAMPGKQSRSDESQRESQIAWLAKVLPALDATMRPALDEVDRMAIGEPDVSDAN